MGGSQYQAQVLISKLIQTGEYEIFYLANRVNPEYKPEGYQLIKISGPDKIRRYGTFVDAINLYRTLRDIGPDVIYQQVGCAYTGIAAYFARRHNSRMIWRITSDKSLEPELGRRRYLPHHLLERMLLNYGISKAHVVVAQTENQNSLLKTYHHRTADSVIRNFHPLPEETLQKKMPIKVIWVANFKRLKQPEYFLRLASDFLDTNNIEFLMIGRPASNERWYQNLVKEAEKQKNIHILGGMSQKEVNENVAKSHILVNTSLYEGFSNTFIQAWMRQVPVASLNVNPDNVFDNEFLGMCANGSYEVLRESIERLVSNDKLIGEMGAKAQQYANEHYSESNMDEIISLFRP